MGGIGGGRMGGRVRWRGMDTKPGQGLLAGRYVAALSVLMNGWGRWTEKGNGSVVLK